MFSKPVPIIIIRQLRAAGPLTLGELKQRTGLKDVAVHLARLMASGKIERVGNEYSLK